MASPRHCLILLMHRSTVLRCLLGVTIEGRRTASEPTAPFAVGGLVGGLRDHRPDPALPKMGSNCARRVRLVGQDRIRGGPGSTDLPRHPQLGHDLGERGRVTSLARREDERERATAAVGGEVDLRGQSSAGASEGMVGWLVGRGPF